MVTLFLAGLTLAIVEIEGNISLIHWAKDAIEPPYTILPSPA